tara:strand:+ start:40 stop:369 length:330 start_codon:yes stop_codon:yes gene_type:complete
MGLKDKLSNEGSDLSTYDGQTPELNLLATKQSPLHYDAKDQGLGWSTKGYESPNPELTIQEYNSYDDGVVNALPEPSNLEFTDENSADPNFKPKFTSKTGNRYEDLKFL